MQLFWFWAGSLPWIYLRSNFSVLTLGGVHIIIVSNVLLSPHILLRILYKEVILLCYIKRIQHGVAKICKWGEKLITGYVQIYLKQWWRYQILDNLFYHHHACPVDNCMCNFQACSCTFLRKDTFVGQHTRQYLFEYRSSRTSKQDLTKNQNNEKRTQHIMWCVRFNWNSILPWHPGER